MKNFTPSARLIALQSTVALMPFSVAYCHLSLLLFFIASFFEGNFIEKGRVIVKNPLAWILPVFFLLHLAGLYYSSNQSTGWSSIDNKLAFAFAPLIIVSANPFTKSELRRVSNVFIASCSVAIIVCLLNAIMVSSSGQPLWNFGPKEPYVALHPGISPLWPYFSYIGLASGVDMHPTYLALYLYVCVLIALGRMTVKFDIRYLLLIMCFLAFIVLLSSRIMVLTTILTIVGVIATSRIKKNRFVGVVALVVIITTLMINPIAQYRNTQEYRSSNFSWPPAEMSDNPISIRMSLWWLSLHAVGEVNPLIGTGTGDVKDTMLELSDRYNVHNILYTADPHNQYLYTFIGLGALGLVWLLVVFAVPLVMLWRRREFLAFVGLISFMCVCMTESALELQKGIILFTLFVSLAGNTAREGSFLTQRLEYA